MRVKSFLGRAPLYFSLLLLVFYINGAYGQFSVIATSPNHGATGVDSTGTCSITFSSAIDTSARFPYPEDFFVNIMFYPDSLVGPPDSITLSPDTGTVYVHNLHLSPNIAYFFVIGNAVSQSGDSLGIPHSIVFTTGSNLPTGTISGTISYPGSDPYGTLVILFGANPFEQDEEDEENAVNGTVIPDSSGTYTIDYVAPGTYWPAAIQNFYIDQWGDIEIQAGSAIGFYDFDGDNRPDSIEVSAGSQISGIDISLFLVTPQTARDPLPMLEALAQAWASDAYLVRLGGDVDPNGHSLFWHYVFYSPSLMRHQAWFIAGDLIVKIKLDETIEDTLAVPVNWLNSDTIMTIAEAHGGREFRMNNPDAVMYGSLGYLDFDSKEEPLMPFTEYPQKFAPLYKLKRARNHQRALFFKTIDPEYISLPAIWVVEYYSHSSGNYFYLIIDAESGIVLNEATTASIAEQQALPVAQDWAGDAELWMIVSQGTNVDSIARTEVWNCLYYSPSVDSLHFVAVWGQLPIAEGPQEWIAPDTTTVPTGWLDSDEAIALAEAAGGAAYRNANEDIFVNAYLSRWFHGPNPDLTVWKFEYTSSTANPLEFLVDAMNDTLISGIDDEGEKSLPSQFALSQNYPNPFNPITQINYALPKDCQVKLEVHNILGQKVASLVDGKQEAGYKTASWDAGSLSSGIYFYRLQAGDFVQTRKMVLLK